MVIALAASALAVYSRRETVRIEFESPWLFCPYTCDVFVGRKPVQRLEPTRMVVCVDEELKMLPKLVVAAVVIAFDGRFFDGAVHALHLAVGPWVVGLGQAVIDVVITADLIEAENPVAGRPAVAISWQVGELDAVVGQDRVQPIRNRLD